jgi:hypothetical protein
MGIWSTRWKDAAVLGLEKSLAAEMARDKPNSPSWLAESGRRIRTVVRDCSARAGC